jgi:hypothetical protein
MKAPDVHLLGRAIEQLAVPASTRSREAIRREVRSKLEPLALATGMRHARVVFASIGARFHCRVTARLWNGVSVDATAYGRSRMESVRAAVLQLHAVLRAAPV